MLLNVSQAQRDTILAALRLWQESGFTVEGNVPERFHDIAAESAPLLNDAQVDLLCEGINGGDLVITTGEQLEELT